MRHMIALPPRLLLYSAQRGWGSEKTRTFLSAVLDFRKERWGSLHGFETLITKILKHRSLYCLFV